MPRAWLLSMVGGLAFSAGFGVQELTRTVVVNLENPHPIVGDVAVSVPIPHSEMTAMVDVVVAPAHVLTAQCPNIFAPALEEVIELFVPVTERRK